MTTTTVSAETARRLLMAGAGLLDAPTRRATRTSVRKLIERMGFVQLDSINVVVRAHQHILHTRLDGYRPDMLATLTERDRQLFEHWTHDASVIPTAWYEYWKPRFERSARRIRGNAWWCGRMGDDGDAIIEHVHERVRREGPLMSKDFEHDRDGESGGWWGWKPQKAALEYLWHTGALAVSRRVHFHKVYDLAERVLPEHHDRPEPDDDAHREWACRTAIERLGVATPGEIAAFWRAVPSTAATAWCREAANAGDIEPVMLEAADGSRPRRAWAVTDWRQRARRAPDTPDRTRLLSPFDPVVRDRRRLKRLFGFDYTFEAFVPERKRQYGYYVLPILEGDRLVGRLDPKLHRDRETLEIRKVWWERGIKATKARRTGLAEAVERLATFCGANSVQGLR